MSARINPELLALARRAVLKSAFVASGDPSMDPAAAAGGDPAAAGGMPPGGSMPPGDPAMAGGGDPLAELMPMIQSLVQQAISQQSAGGGMADGGIKPKIDVNVEMMQIKNMLAKIMDAMQITMPVSEMVATPDKLNQMAAEQQGAPPAPQGGAIPPVGPIDPMKAASFGLGVAFSPPQSMTYAHATAADQLMSKAQALLLQHRARQGN